MDKYLIKNYFSLIPKYKKEGPHYLLKYKTPYKQNQVSILRNENDIYTSFDKLLEKENDLEILSYSKVTLGGPNEKILNRLSILKYRTEIQQFIQDLHYNLALKKNRKCPAEHEGEFGFCSLRIRCSENVRDHEDYSFIKEIQTEPFMRFKDKDFLSYFLKGQNKQEYKFTTILENPIAVIEDFGHHRDGLIYYDLNKELFDMIGRVNFIYEVNEIMSLERFKEAIAKKIDKQNKELELKSERLNNHAKKQIQESFNKDKEYLKRFGLFDTF